MKKITFSFKLILISTLLWSCSISPKTKCIRNKEGRACFQAAQGVLKSIDKKDKNEIKEKTTQVVDWYRFGCQYKNAESCYNLGKYYLKRERTKGSKFLSRACGLGLKKACR